MPYRREVRETYERIAVHFAETRPEPWSEVVAFLEGQSGEFGLDVGAGNGRHAELLAAHVDRVLAVDASRAAIGTALDRSGERGFGLEVSLGDAATLPVRDGCVDLAAYIATIHHLPNRALRVESLNELARVLAADGAAIVSAWSVSHDRFDRDSGFDTHVDWTLPDGETVPRFYHVYDSEEFGGDLAESSLVVEEQFESHGNCYAVVRPEG